MSSFKSVKGVWVTTFWKKKLACGMVAVTQVLDEVQLQVENRLLSPPSRPGDPGPSMNCQVQDCRDAKFSSACQ